MGKFIPTTRDLAGPTSVVIEDALYDVRASATAEQRRAIVRQTARQLGWTEGRVWDAVNRAAGSL